MSSEKNVAIIKSKSKELGELLTVVDTQIKTVQGIAVYVKCRMTKDLVPDLVKLWNYVGPIQLFSAEVGELSFKTIEDQCGKLSKEEIAASVNRWASTVRELAFNLIQSFPQGDTLPPPPNIDPHLWYQAAIVCDMKKLADNLYSISSIMSELSIAIGALGNDDVSKSTQSPPSSGHLQRSFDR